MSDDTLSWNEPDGSPRRGDRSRRAKDPSERRWTMVAVTLGISYLLIGALAAPVLWPAADALIDQLSGSSSASPVSLVYPVDGAIVTGTTSSLSWNCSIDASYYVLLISDDRELSDPYNVTTRQNGLVLSGLEMGTTYYWKVCPVTDGAYGAWSEIWSFTVGSSTGSPTPVTPYNSTIYIDEIPVLTWTAVSGASGYKVEISTDENFTSVMASVEVSGTNYTAGEMVTENTTYFWRVAAITDDGWSAWSQPMALFVSPLSYTVERTWTFYEDGSTWTLGVNVSAITYWEAKTLPRAVMFSEMEYANYVTNDGVVNEVAQQLAAMAASKGYDAYTTACFVLSFVQNTYYDSDLNTTGKEEYPRYPVETLVDGTGDCEDTSILFASLIQTTYFDMDAVLVSFSTPSSSAGHMAVGLYFDAADLPSAVSYTYNGTDYELALEDMLSWKVQTYRYGQSYTYYYCECTSEMPIGWPTEIEEWYHTIIPC